MAPSVRLTDTDGGTSSTTSFTLDTTGAQSGDLGLVIISLESDVTLNITHPSGWELMWDNTEGGNQTRQLAYKNVQLNGTEGAQTWNMDSSDDVAAALMVFQDADLAFDVASADNAVGGWANNSASTPSVTTSQDDCLLLHFFTTEDRDDLTGEWEAAVTEIVDTGQSVGVWNGVYVATEVQATAGSTSPREITFSTNANHQRNVIAVAPGPESQTVEAQHLTVSASLHQPEIKSGIFFINAQTDAKAGTNDLVISRGQWDEGDFLVAVISCNSGDTISPQESWTEAYDIVNPDDQIRQIGYYRFSDDTNNEPTSYTFTKSDDASGFIAAFSGVDTTNPFTGIGFAERSNNSSVAQTPDPFGLVDGQVSVIATALSDPTTVDALTGYSEEVDNSSVQHVGMQHKKLASTGNDPIGELSSTGEGSWMVATWMLTPSGADLSTSIPQVRATGNSSEQSSTPEVLIPAGLDEGEDVLVSVWTIHNGTVSSGPSGWTHLHSIKDGTSDIQHEIYYKVSEVGDSGSPISLTWDGTEHGWCSVVALKFASTPDVSSSNSGNSTTPTASGITTLEDSSLLLAVYSVDSNLEISAPTGMDNVYVEATNVSTLPGIGAFSEIQETAGASGDKQASISSSSAWVASLLSIPPPTQTVETEHLDASPGFNFQAPYQPSVAHVISTQLLDASASIHDPQVTASVTIEVEHLQLGQHSDLLEHFNYEPHAPTNDMELVWQVEQTPDDSTGTEVPERLRMVTGVDVPGSGSKKPVAVYRAEIQEGDSFGDDERAECYDRHGGGGTPAEDWPDPPGSTRWYGFNILIPSGFNFAEDTKWRVVTQWKGFMSGSPPVALEIKRQTFELVVKNESARHLLLDSISTDTWYRLEIGIKFETDQTGWVRVFLDGEEVLEETASQTLDLDGTDPVPSYLKQGIYRDPTFSSDDVVYYGPLLLGTSHESVQSATSFTHTPSVATSVSTNHLGSTVSVENPTVTGSILVEANHLSVGQTFHDPSVTASSLVETQHLNAAPTLHNPSVDTTATVDAQHLNSEATLYNASVGTTTTVEANHLTVTVSVESPTVEPGAVTVTTNLLSVAQTFHNPTVEPGQVVVEPNLLSVAVTVSQPTVTTTVEVTANHLDATETVHNPSVDTTIVPQHIASTVTFFQPQVKHEIDSFLLSAAPTVYTADVYHVVATQHLSVATQLFQPDVSQTVFAEHLQTSTSVENPTVEPGSVEVAPNHLTVTPSFYNPSFYYVIEAHNVTSTVTLRSPDVSQTVAAQHITSTVATNQPDVVYQVEAQTITSTVSPHNPSVKTETTIQTQLLSAAPTLHQPETYFIIEVQELKPGLQAHSPSVNTETTVSTQHLSVEPSLSQPKVQFSVATQHLTVGQTFHSADVDLVVKPNHVASTVSVQQPQVTHIVDSFLLSAAPTVFTPQAAFQIDTQKIAVSAQVFSPDVSQTVFAQHLNAEAQAHEPVVTTGETLVQAQHLDASAAFHAPNVTYVFEANHLDSSPTLHQPGVAFAVSTLVVSVDATVSEPDISQIVETELVSVGEIHEPELYHVVATQLLAVTIQAFSPDVTYTVNANHLDATPTISQPQVWYIVDPFHLSAPLAVFTPQTAFVINSETVNAAPQVHSPDVEQIVAPQNIGSTSQTFDPAVNVGQVAVEPQHLAVNAVFHNPDVEYRVDTQTLAVEITTHDPGVAFVISSETLGSTVETFEPSAAFVVSTETFNAQVSVHSPDVSVTVFAETLDASPALFSPQVTYVVEAALGEFGPQTHEPSIQKVVAVEHLQVAAQISQPDLYHIVAANTIQIDVQIYQPKAQKVVDPFLLSAEPEVFTPESTYIVDAEHLNVSQTVNSPSVAHVISTQILSASPTINEPKVYHIVEAEHLNVGPQTHAPDVEHVVATQTLTVAAQIFDPTVDTTVTVVTLHLDNAAVLFQPQVKHVVESFRLVADATVFTPQTSFVISTNHFDSTPTVHAPSQTYLVEAQAAEAPPQVHEPTVAVGEVVVETQHLSAQPTVYSPEVTQIVAADHLSAAPNLHNPLVAFEADLPSIDAQPTVHPPDLIYLIQTGFISVSPTVEQPSAAFSIGHVALDATPQPHNPDLYHLVETNHVSVEPVFHPVAVVQEGDVLAGFLQVSPTVHSPEVTYHLLAAFLQLNVLVNSPGVRILLDRDYLLDALELGWQFPHPEPKWKRFTLSDFNVGHADT